MPKSTQLSSRKRTRRRAVGGATPVRVLAPSQPRTVKASRRAYFDLYAPRIVLSPWRTEAAWRASRPKFFAAVLMVGLVFALYQLLNSPAFFVGELSANGTHLLSPAEVEAAAAIRGQNIFYLNPSEIANALEKLPEVKAAQVSLVLPNQVHARIVERQPRFLWEAHGEKYWVDDDGIALRVRGNLPGLFSLKDADEELVRVGERVNAGAFNTAVSLRNAWQNSPRNFEWSRAHGLAIRDEHGWLIYFGNANQMADKLAALKIVTAQIVKEHRAVAFIDLGNGLPYYQEVVLKK